MDEILFPSSSSLSENEDVDLKFFDAAAELKTFHEGMDAGGGGTDDDNNGTSERLDELKFEANADDYTQSDNSGTKMQSGGEDQPKKQVKTKKELEEEEREKMQ